MKPFVKAATKAVLLWAAIYVVAIHVNIYVTYPLSTTQPLDDNAEMKKRQRNEDAKLKAQQQQLLLKEQMEKQHAQLQKVSTELGQKLQTLKTDAAHVLSNLQQRIAVLHHTIHQVTGHSTKPKPEEFIYNVPQLQNLLQRESLDDLNGAELQQLFEGAMQDLQLLLTKEDGQDLMDMGAWNKWREVVSESYNRIPPTTHSCSSSEGEPTIPTYLARESHLFSSVNQVETVIAQRTIDSPLVTDESLKRVLQVIQEAVQTPLAQQQDDEDTTLQDDNCIEKEDVEWLVEEGLNALQRHQDLRLVLSRALQELDEEGAKNAIMDAMLSSPSKPNYNLPPNDKVNLRQWLDTPIVSQKAPEWVDVAVDGLSGHVDILDQTLDSLINEDQSVGKILVSKLLNLAGKLSIPNPYRHIDSSRAGILKNHYP